MTTATDLNQFIKDNALRRYQHDILRKGAFDYPDPRTGQIRKPFANYLLPGAAAFYLFAGSEPFILIAASLKDGFPLTAQVTASGVRALQDPPLRPDLIALAQTLLTDRNPLSIDPGRPPEVTLGDPNFAHFMWNEFPALHTALGLGHHFVLNRRFDPLGVLPQLAHAHNVSVHDLDAPNAGKGWKPAAITPLGSIHCAAAAKSALMSLLKLPPAAPCRDTFWLTLRDKGRTLDNQIEFLSAFITRQRANSRHSHFYIDGFSCPQDLNRPLYGALRPKFTARITGAQRLAQRLIAAQPTARITDATGLSLVQTLKLIRRCGFYVSHTGTMQHKAGWFYPLAGIQHGNQASLTPAALQWPARMIAGAQAPFGITARHVMDTGHQDQPMHNARNTDYRITDIPAAVDDIMRARALLCARQPAV